MNETDQGNSEWQSEQIAVLRDLKLADIPGLELILLDELGSWAWSDDNPGHGYNQDHGAQVIGKLLIALGRASSFRPAQVPLEPAEIMSAIMTARQRIVAGAHELADAENPALLFARLFPAVDGELKRHEGDPGAQVRWLYYYSLLAVGAGISGDPDIAGMGGLMASFDSWLTLMEGRNMPSSRNQGDAAQTTSLENHAPSASLARPEEVGCYPAVTWDEVREHLVSRLYIDDEWRVDGHQRFTWWPWFLKQDVAVTANDTGTGAARPDAMIRITATTEILHVTDEALGLQIVAQANRQFPYGAFILQNGVVRATSSVALNPLCRGMLTAFHFAALIQATVAHQVATSHRDTPGITILASSHPRSGLRQDPDELLEIYSGEVCSLPQVDGFGHFLLSARPIYRQLLLDGGFEAGFSDSEVDYFDGDGLDIAVGTVEGQALERRYGSGLVVMTRFLSLGTEISASDVNAMNEDISQLSQATQLGPTLGDGQALRYGLHTKTYLHEGFLASVRGETPEVLATEIVNAVYHSVGAVRLFLDTVG